MRTLSQKLSQKLSLTHIAQICHEANRAYSEALGSTDHLPWGSAPDWQRDSAIAGVCHALSALSTPESLHSVWMSKKLSDGWKYGPKKDAELKEHPCLLPYLDLPIEERLKDSLFYSICSVFRGSLLLDIES